MKTRSVDDFGSVVEKAAADARLARDRVLRIDPQPAKRIGKTDYLEQATEIELLAVNLTQLVDFVLRLATTDDQLTIHTLRLRPPHESTTTSNEELWLADVVLTQRIYSPATPDR